MKYTPRLFFCFGGKIGSRCCESNHHPAEEFDDDRARITYNVNLILKIALRFWFLTRVTCIGITFREKQMPPELSQLPQGMRVLSALWLRYLHVDRTLNRAHS